MVGEPLTCIWQAVYALSRDETTPSFPAHRFKELISSFSGLKLLKFSEFNYELFFADQNYSFDKVKDYVSKELLVAGASEKMLYDEIELACWNACKDSYRSRHGERTLMKLWQISNRIITKDTYPPVVRKDEISWFSEKVSTNLNIPWETRYMRFPEKGMTFQHWIEYLDSTVFQNEDFDSLTKCIDDMYCWLVKEILKFGWMRRRSKTKSNWTSWSSQWFVLTPGKLQCFKSDSKYKSNTQKHTGELYITADCKYEMLPVYKGILRTYPNRFKITNLPHFEYELAVDSESEMKKWLACFEEVVKCCATKTTPIQKLLKSRQDKGSETEKKLEGKRKKSVQYRKIRKEKIEKNEEKIEEVQPVKMREKGMDKNDPGDAAFNLLKEEEKKLKGVFVRIDTDGNGLLNYQEFLTFLDELGIRMTEKEAKLVFNSVDKDKNGEINFDEFKLYFLKYVLNENETADCVAAMRKAFLQADKDGTGTVDFKEFTEYVWEKKRSMRISTLLSAFQSIDNAGQGDLDFDNFKDILSTSNLLSSTLPKTETDERTTLALFDQQLKTAFERSESEDLARYIRGRWDKFASFRRLGANGEIAMKGGHGMVDDLVPGEYNLVDLVCFSDLPPLVPKYTIIHNVQWISSRIPGKSGKVSFPMDFDGKIETDIATNEHLRYYDCSIADAKQEKISLVYRHGIQDFTYENNYLSEYVTKSNGGAGIEKHGFSHLDCPLVQDSGIFILAKMVGDDMHVTGFRVPIRHTLYIPGGCIHSNDYLKGTWRTMLSDEGNIDHVHLTKRTNAGDRNSQQIQYLTFEFS